MRIPFCVDCLHHRIPMHHSMCGRPKRGEPIDPVTGRVIRVMTYCETERALPWRCGRRGRYFTANFAAQQGPPPTTAPEVAP